MIGNSTTIKQHRLISAGNSYRKNNLHNLVKIG